MSTQDRAADFEKVIIGACLLENEPDRELCLNRLQPEILSLDSYRLVFAAIGRLHAANQPVSIITVMHELAGRGQLAAIGGTAVLMEFTEGLPRQLGETQLANYIERVREFWRLRQLCALGALMDSAATDGVEMASSIVQTVTERLETIVSDSATDVAGISESIVASMNRFHEQRSLERSPGMSYGLPTLDAQTGGMMAGFQTAVGAASGIGKTTFMCQAILAALESGSAVDAFLLEPTRDQVTMRLLSLMSGVRYSAVVKPWTCRQDEADRISEQSWRLAEMPLRLHDRPSLTLDEVVGLARVGINRYGTKLVCLDYIQRLKIRSTERDEPMRLKVARASTAMADLVKGTPCHSLLLSQINTGRKAGAAAIPTMFDFRESSQIENDAHTIVLLHRTYDDAEGHYTNDGAIFVPKQRFGSPCNMRVRFDPVTAAWQDDAAPTYQQTWQERQEA